MSIFRDLKVKSFSLCRAHLGQLGSLGLQINRRGSTGLKAKTRCQGAAEDEPGSRFCTWVKKRFGKTEALPLLLHHQCQEPTDSQPHGEDQQVKRPFHVAWENMTWQSTFSLRIEFRGMGPLVKYVSAQALTQRHMIHMDLTLTDEQLQQSFLGFHTPQTIHRY
jgi:hypothetical protein